MLRSLTNCSDGHKTGDNPYRINHTWLNNGAMQSRCEFVLGFREAYTLSHVTRSYDKFLRFGVAAEDHKTHSAIMS